MANLHGRIAAGAPRWAVAAAYATTLTVLPSGVWRVLTVNAHAPLLRPARRLGPAAGRGHDPLCAPPAENRLMRVVKKD